MQMRAQRAGPDPAPGTRQINFERGNVEDGYGNGDRGIGAGRMRGMVLRAGRRMEAGGRCVCGAEWQLRAPCVGDGEPGKGFGRI